MSSNGREGQRLLFVLFLHVCPGAAVLLPLPTALILSPCFMTVHAGVCVHVACRAQQHILLDALVPKPARKEMEERIGSAGGLRVALPDTPATTLIDMLTGLLEDKRPQVGLACMMLACGLACAVCMLMWHASLHGAELMMMVINVRMFVTLCPLCSGAPSRTCLLACFQLAG